jgi:hypothetical protein
VEKHVGLYLFALWFFPTSNWMPQLLFFGVEGGYTQQQECAHIKSQGGERGGGATPAPTYPKSSQSPCVRVCGLSKSPSIEAEVWVIKFVKAVEVR